MRKLISLIAVCIFCAGNFLWAQTKPLMWDKNVYVIDSAFYMPQLNRHRRIWIYLPGDYFSTKKKYPVIYMQDGQNVFEKSTSFAGEWGVDEALGSLENKEGKSIVVAIDNGGDKRINEYSIYDTEKFGKAEGKEYLEFVVKTLKPFIDKKYRTKSRAKYTCIAGSSLGGLISFYGMLQYPKVFGAAGVFSPSFWMVPQLKKEIETTGRKIEGRIYFYAGKLEGEEMIEDMLSFFELMNRHSKVKMTSVIRTEGKHNEASWRKEFPLFYRWLMQ